MFFVIVRKEAAEVVKKFIDRMIASYKKIDYIFMGALCLVVLYNSVPAGIASIIAMVAVIVYHSVVLQPENEKRSANSRRITPAKTTGSRPL